MKRGIDISYHQGSIDFSKVKKAGIDFVIARSSYRNTVDKKFHEYMKDCKVNGIPVLGVYHFIYALTEQAAIEEAKFCIKQVEKAGLSKDDIVIFADFEYDTVDKAKAKGVVLGPAECNAFTKAFCEYVESCGYKAGIYSNIDYYKNWYNKELLEKYVFWLADYTGGPDYDCVIQQYTSSGSVEGISGRVDMNYYYGEKKVETTTKVPMASEVVKLAESLVGKNEADGSFKEIIDIYNSYKGPFPRGVKMKYDWAWCACTWSAIAIKLGYTEFMPIEISCGQLIENAKKMNCWAENDGYVPKPGDAILYDWDDSGLGDNTAWPDHVGIVAYVNKDAGYIIVVEGNYNNAVKKRTVSINGRYIRGFITPLYGYEGVSLDDRLRKSGKDNSTVAKEVIAGVWGSGEERKTLLKHYGYKYSEIQKLVNQILNGEATKTTKPVQSQAQPASKKVTATCKATTMSKALAGTYKTTANLYLRNDAGTNKKALCVVPKGAEVRNYGYYSFSNNVKWLYIQVTIDGVLYTGFSSSKYLKKK